MSIPNYVVTTGDFIAEWMADEGINAAELARRLGVTRKHVSELLSGKAPLSPDVALSLERVTGVPARIWTQYESGYRTDLARLKEQAKLEAQHDQAKEFPLKYLRQHGLLTASARDHAGVVRELLSLLGVGSLDALRDTWTGGSVAYRRAAFARTDAPKLATWLTLGERSVDMEALPPFDRAKLPTLLPELRSITRMPVGKGVDLAIKKLGAVGVGVCLVPAIPGLGIHGATRWVRSRPLIQLSLLFKSDDQLWFTLFHELAHVLLHGDRNLYTDADASPEEDEANAFAASVLIPEEHEPRIPRGRDLQRVEALAAELGIAPSIVLGRAQRITGDYAWGAQLRTRVELEVDPSRFHRRPPAFPPVE